jgi:glycosyltransferase involved in cell wall biosynthesis
MFEEAGRSLPQGAWLPVVIDLAEPVPDVPTRNASHLRVMALWHGQPLGHLVVPALIDPYPGHLLGEALVRAFARPLHHHRIGRLLTPPPARGLDPPSGTVVVCTRNRPDQLGRCLRSLASMRPRDHLEVLVVDNGDRDEAVQSLVEQHGFRWVHEPVPGLNRARNRGLLEASGDVVLFADDDVAVLPRWADRLLDCFARDPLVGAAAGLVLPAVLDSEHQRILETHFGFSRGTERRILDGAEFAPLGAGALGAGASMAFRRALMLDLGGFPEALDGGMPTKSGGDTYGLYRVLRAGYRGVYEPQALSLHWHRDGRDELLRTVRGYSTGTYSFLLEALIRDRDLRAIPVMAGWTARWTLRRIAAAALRRPSAPPLWLALVDLVGGLQAPVAVRRAHRMVRDRGGQLQLPRRDAFQPLEPRGRPSPEPLRIEESPDTVSVVIPTHGRRERVLDLVRKLDAQRTRPAEVVVVVDGDVDGTGSALAVLDVTTTVRTVVHARNQGAAVARNTGAQAASGDVLVFLDDDVTPRDPLFLGEHLAAHRSRNDDVAVAGPCVPAPVRDERPLTLATRNWWIDHVGRLTTAGSLAFTDLVTGNFSIDRGVFAESGGFRPMPRREDWEFSYRLVRSGITITAAPGAVVIHPTDHDVANMLHDRMDEGAGDYHFAELHPEVAHALPLWTYFSVGARMKAVISGMFVTPEIGKRALGPLTMAVESVNRVGARRTLTRLVGRAYCLAYFSGVARAAGTEARFLGTLSRSPAWGGGLAAPPVPYELTAVSWDAPDPTSIELELTVGGRPLTTVSSRLGGFPWSAQAFGRRLGALPRHSLAEQVAGAGA